MSRVRSPSAAPTSRIRESVASEATLSEPPKQPHLIPLRNHDFIKNLSYEIPPHRRISLFKILEDKFQDFFHVPGIGLVLLQNHLLPFQFLKRSLHLSLFFSQIPNLTLKP